MLLQIPTQFYLALKARLAVTDGRFDNELVITQVQFPKRHKRLVWVFLCRIFLELSKGLVKLKESRSRMFLP